MAMNLNKDTAPKVKKEFYDEITNNYIQRFWITF